MTRRTDIWNVVLITAVTVLIWFWAAAETRIQRDVIIPEVQLRVPQTTSRWSVQPESTFSATIAAEGSQRAITKIESIAVLRIDLPAIEGPQEDMDLEALIRAHPEIEETGVAIQSINIDPIVDEFTLYELATATVRVGAVALPGIKTVEPPRVMPMTVEVELPASETRAITLKPKLETSDLASLVPGETRTLSARLIGERWLEDYRREGLAHVRPNEVDVVLTVSTTSMEVAPPGTVRVQVAGSPEDRYTVELETKFIRDVRVVATGELGPMIESGDAPVFAIVYLKEGEKEDGITSKPVTFFVAILPDGTGEIVEAKIDGNPKPPIVKLEITEKPAPAEP